MGKRAASLRLRKRFDREAKCHRRLERLRWPQGLVCPSCSGRRISRFLGRGKTGKKRRLYTCLACRYQYTVTAGTFLHDSHLALKKWFAAIFALRPSLHPLVARPLPRRVGGLRGSARGASCGRPPRPAPKRVFATQLQRQLKLGSYKTAWSLARRIRRAMAQGDPLLGQMARLARRR